MQILLLLFWKQHYNIAGRYVVFFGNQTDCGISLHDCGVVTSKGNVTFSEWGSRAISGGGNSTLIMALQHSLIMVEE